MKPLALVLFLSMPAVVLADGFTGFWKPSCGDAFGVQIKLAEGNLYSVSFCGPGGCFEPGTWTPDTTIAGDPKYKVISATQLGIKQQGTDAYNTYTKCSDDPSAVAATPGAPPSESRIKYKAYYEGIPDYENKVVFPAEASDAALRLRKSLLAAPTSSALCKRGSVEASVVPAHDLVTNICDSSAYGAVVAALKELAPSLNPSRLAFRKVDLRGGKEPQLLVEYTDLVGDDQVKDPYLTLWLLSFEQSRLRATHVGPFLVGQILTYAPFGQNARTSQVFVRHQSCTECDPWIYLTAVDFLRQPSGDVFKFTYSQDHKDFGYTIEYSLPGEGHSVDAEVETRIAKPSRNGPHLIQRFDLDGGVTEWWVFTCNDLQCDFEMSTGGLPGKYKASWETGNKL